ncbi:hypothetical protein ACCC92_03055 [Mucilaginibacter sp. Mucisp84]|uniref:hypothetical protein n=1 Tax=Mucilaginibacter sp. Mucisp84 TaxID=3243058 RepID=UPI0039A56B58
MLKVPRSYIKGVAIEVDSRYDLENAPFIPKAGEVDENNDAPIKKRNWITVLLHKALLPFRWVAARLRRKKVIDPESAPLDQQSSFIGREQHIAKFVEFLRGNNRKGVFLVTGYRGMGKTSFVNKVLKKYSDVSPSKQDLIKPIRLTLAQTNPKEIDILRLMVMGVFDEFRVHLKKNDLDEMSKNRTRLYRLQHLLLFIILFSLPLALLLWKVNHLYALYRSTDRQVFAVLIIYASFVAALCLIYSFSYFRLKNRRHYLQHADGASNRITWLVERCNAALGEEVTNSEGGLPAFNFKLFNEEKKTKQYAVVSNKEIEYELQAFLEKAKSEYNLEFIFVFDELDKVEPALNSLGSDFLDSYDSRGKSRNYENDLKDRRLAIVSIIAGLKNFLTTADARFIFIAGREMFDASLADISDRQSSISSIFTFVFYIESLLKEKNNNNNPSLSSAIEDYLKYLLFGETTGISLTERLGAFRTADTMLDGELAAEEQGKLYFIFQNFITYLTYRSNGSPKKLIKEIHEFIILEDKVAQIKKDQDGQDIIYEHRIRPAVEKAPGRKLYLYFNYYNQYRIGFINYLYRPFLIKYGRSFKLFSDNIVVSTPYLFDHLLKFHPFAFSISNLELLPEILSSSKTPALRSHIRKIIEYLGANHIREIEIGLFDYKFYSRTFNEITFLSRVFEQEAAALNYTLDESYYIKRLVVNKIKELRSDYSSSPGGLDNAKQIFSIAHLNGILGDLYFFDQEYDDAIVAYSDAIRTISYERTTVMSLRDFIVLIRTKLKMGLCFEKINAYDDALAQFVDSNSDASRLMNYRLNEGQSVVINRKDELKDSLEDSEDSNEVTGKRLVGYDMAVYRSAALSDLLQIILQGFLSQLFIQEKKSVAGISEYKLFTTLGSFFKITEGFKLNESRNHIIKANAFLHAGNLIYFKNSDRRIRFEDKEINDAFHQNLPRRLKANLTTLAERYDASFCNHQGFRKPVLALYLYILGMVETLNYGNHKQLQSKGQPLIPEKPDTEPDEIILGIVTEENVVFELLDRLTREEKAEGKASRGIYYNYIASFLGNIGDCLLSHCNNRSDQFKSISLDVLLLQDKKGEGQPPGTDCIFSIREPFKKVFKEKRIADLFLPDKFSEANLLNDEYLFDSFLKPSEEGCFSMADVLRCYYLAGRFYLKQGRISSCSFQYRKILYTMRLVLDRHNPDTLTKSFIRMLNNKILRPCLEYTSQNAHSTDRHMLNKAIANLRSGLGDFALNNLSNHPETKELILAYNYIKIKLGRTDIRISGLISPANSFATQQSRLLELDLYAKYLEEKKPGGIEGGLITTTAGEVPESTMLNGTAYLYSMLSILRILDIYGSDYWLGHSYFAYTHFRVGLYLSKLGNDTALIESQLESLLGSGSYASLDIGYHFSKAKELYEKAMQLHSAGDAYKNMIEDMIYLEDDFNDSAYHFGAALDRYMMTNRMFAERVKSCNKEIKKRAIGLQEP